MLTQYIVRSKLDAIAADVLRMPGIYYELYSRLFSQRVHEWMKSVSRSEAALIESVAELDPDYCAHFTSAEFEYGDNDVHAHHNRAQALFNPAWDVQY